MVKTQTLFLTAILHCIIPYLLMSASFFHQPYNIEDDYIEAMYNILKVCVPIYTIVCWAYRCITNPPKMLDLMSPVVMLAIGTVGMHLVAIAFGAPFFQKRDFLKTLLWAEYMSFLVVVPAAVELPFNWRTYKRIFLFYNCWNDPIETICLINALCVLLGAWIGALPIPLDWDRKWQVWPISCTYGALMGKVVGSVVSLVYICTANNTKIE